ncbi:MAG: hypothetical protein ACREXV_15890, partial [Polaromonas sp.]
GTPGPGSPACTTCLNDAVNEHVAQSVAKTPAPAARSAQNSKKRVLVLMLISQTLLRGNGRGHDNEFTKKNARSISRFIFYFKNPFGDFS